MHGLWAWASGRQRNSREGGKSALLKTGASAVSTGLGRGVEGEGRGERQAGGEGVLGSWGTFLKNFMKIFI